MWLVNVKVMYRVLSEFNFKLAFRSKRTYIFSLDTSCLCYSIKCHTTGVPEVICAQRHTTTCMSRHSSRWLLHLFPQTIPYKCTRLVWVPGYHSFPWWVRVRVMVTGDAHITRVFGMGIPIPLWHCSSSGAGKEDDWHVRVAALNLVFVKASEDARGRGKRL